MKILWKKAAASVLSAGLLLNAVSMLPAHLMTAGAASQTINACSAGQCRMGTDRL